MYTFIHEEPKREYVHGWPTTHHTKKIEFTVEDDSGLEELCDAFEHFLKACGYEFDGNIDIVPEHGFEDTVRNSIDDATPEEWNQAYKNVKVTYK
jgi:hypothetical protein